VHGRRWTQAVVVHGCQWTRAAGGAAGRANIGLCTASSLILFG